MEEPHDLSRDQVKSRDIRPFETIAMDATEREVFGFRQATVLFRNDVIDLERGPPGRPWNVAVLAAAARTLPNAANKLRTQRAPARLFNTRRALDCIREIKLSTCI